MKYLDEYRDGDVAKRPRGRHRRHRHAAVGPHGGLRRADAFDRPLRHRSHAPADDRAGARAGLSGVRHVARDDRPRARHRRAPDVIFTSFGDMLRVPGSRGDLLTLTEQRRRRPHRLLAARRRRASRARTRPSASSSSRSASRPRRRPTRWPSIARRRDGVSQLLDARVARARAAGDDGDPRGARAIACRASSVPATSARSWGSASTRRSRSAIACRSSSRGFEPRRPARRRAACACGSSRQGRAEVENQYARTVAARGQPRGARSSSTRSSRSCDRKWRGIGTHPESRLPAARRVSRARRRAHLRGRATSRPRESSLCISG